MKNIGYIVFDFLPTPNAGAVRSSFIADELIDLGYNLFIFTSAKNLNYNIVSTRIVPHPKKKDKNITRLIKEFLYGIGLFFTILFKKRMDIYIISTPPFFIAIFAFLASKIKNKNNLILDVRDIYPEVFFENKLISKNGFVGKILKKAEYFLYKNSKSIITVTNGLKELISLHNFNSENIILIRNGYDENLFYASKFKNKNFTIVFHGTLGKFQNIELLVELINYFNKTNQNIKFLVIGSGVKEILLRNIELNNFTYLDNIEYKDIPGVISKCHLGISLRTDDNIGKTAFPVKIFEYIGVAIPIINTPISESGRIIEENNFGLQSDNNIELVVKNIQKIINNYDSFVSSILKKRSYYSRQYQSKKLVTLVK